jgi:glycine cleavage system H lipoate-binding protein
MTVILVVSMIVVFLLIDAIYLKTKAKSNVPQTAAPVTKSPSFARYSEDEILVPQSVFFGKGHTWVSLKQSGNVQVGMDDFVNRFLGKIQKISLKGIGEEIKKGSTLFTVEQNGKKLSFVSPVSGTIYSLNDAIMGDPKNLSENSYDKNWLCTITPKNLSVDLKLMKVADEASKWIKEEMNRLKDFIAGVNVEDSLIGATLHDGGAPVKGIMEYMDDKTWEKFQNDFLSE